MNSSRTSALRNRHFIRHYVEMVVAMFAGMFVLGIPAEAGLRALGSSTAEIREVSPALVLVGMCVMMTIPMVALMRFRGHSWRPCWEMTASMAIPTAGAIVLLWAGVVGYHAAMTLEHVVMLPAMLAAMLLRPAEYACHDHGAHGAAPAEALA